MRRFDNCPTVSDSCPIPRSALPSRLLNAPQGPLLLDYFGPNSFFVRPCAAKSCVHFPTTVQYYCRLKLIHQLKIRNLVALINAPDQILSIFILFLGASRVNTLQQGAMISLAICIKRLILIFLLKITYSCGARFANLVTTQIVSSVVLIAKTTTESSKSALLYIVWFVNSSLFRKNTIFV